MYTCILYLTYYHVRMFFIELQATNQVFINPRSKKLIEGRLCWVISSCKNENIQQLKNQTLLFAKDFIRVSCSLGIVSASHFDRNTYHVTNTHTFPFLLTVKVHHFLCHFHAGTELTMFLFLRVCLF